MCALQLVILASDAPRLVARDSATGRNISYITHKDADHTNLSDLLVETGHQGFKPLFRAVQSLYHSSCDALLSDADTMAALKVCTTAHPILFCCTTFFQWLNVHDTRRPVSTILSWASGCMCAPRCCQQRWTSPM